MSVLHINTCHGGGPPEPPGDPDDYSCCMGAVMNGPRGCTCWEPVLDLEQAPLQEGPMGLRAKCCHDCAYRQDSPERAADGYEAFGGLEEVAHGARSFFCCHQGVRRALTYRHPEHGEAPAGAGDYKPPIAQDRIWRADGRPGELCAGWAAIGTRGALR